MLMWVVAIIVFSVLIVVHEAGHLLVAKRNGIEVETFSVGLGKKLFGKKFGQTEYRISLVPFGGYCKMAGEDPAEAEGGDHEFASVPPGRRFWVVASGALMNYLFAFVLFCLVFMIGVPVLSNQVGDVMDGMPASTAGLREGDRIVAVNGREIRYWDDILQGIGRYEPGTGAISLTFLRNGETFERDLVPEIQETANIFGQTVSRPMIGVAPSGEIGELSYGFFPAVYHGSRKLLQLTGLTYKGLWMLITGALPVEGSVAGPIGIAHLMGEAARMGIVPLLLLTANVSMALAVFNLLPFPILDGGHILFIGIEKLRGRPVDAAVQEKVTQVALFLIIALFLFVSWQDLVNFTRFFGE